MVKIAVQTYSLSQECSTDLIGTLDALHRIGFQSVEPPMQHFIALPGIQEENPNPLWSQNTLATAAKHLHEMGMECSSVHIGASLGSYALPMNVIQDNILMLHDTFGITDFATSGVFKTTDMVKHWAELSQKISDIIRPYGCRLLYHNHNDEFQMLDGRDGNSDAMELFLELTGDDVLLQVDIGWAAMETDVLAFLRKHANRVGSIHLKDFYPGYQQYKREEMPTEMFAPIGEGVIPTKEALSMLDSFPNFGGTVIIDQDKSSDNLRDMEIGYRNIRRMLSDREESA